MLFARPPGLTGQITLHLQGNTNQLKWSVLISGAFDFGVKRFHSRQRRDKKLSAQENMKSSYGNSLQWRHNGRDGVSDHQPRDCLLNRLFRRRSKKTSRIRVTDLCAGNSPADDFPAQMASNAEIVFFWWHHHVGLYVAIFFIAKWCAAYIHTTSQWHHMSATPPLGYTNLLSNMLIGIISKDRDCSH